MNDHSSSILLTRRSNVFNLTLKYGVGQREFPQLNIAANLMNNAGVMGSYEPQDLKKELSKLNATCEVFATDGLSLYYHAGL